MELKDILREYKEHYHLTNKEIATQCHVTPNTVARWLRGEIKTLQEDTAYHLSKVLGYDVQTILQGKAVSMKKPILGTVKAGYNLFLDSEYLGEEDVTVDEYKKGDFFLQVSGDSMIYAGIKDGGLAYIKKTEIVHSGEIAVISIGDEVTIKTFIKQKDGIILQAANPNIEDRSYTFQEIEELPIRIIGKVLFCKNYINE